MTKDEAAPQHGVVVHGGKDSAVQESRTHQASDVGLIKRLWPLGAFSATVPLIHWVAALDNPLFDTLRPWVVLAGLAVTLGLLAVLTTRTALAVALPPEEPSPGLRRYSSADALLDAIVNPQLVLPVAALGASVLCLRKAIRLARRIRGPRHARPRVFGGFASGGGTRTHH
jgi:hypothetical protein